MKRFAPYVDDLIALLHCEEEKRVEAALDGAVSGELRRRIALDLRRAKGAFFTSQDIAVRLIADEAARASAIVDPAVGCGDLLLAAARALPLKRSVTETLLSWGRVLHGSDVEEIFVRAARIRLALLASQRLGRRTRLDERRLGELLPRIIVSDGQRQSIPEGAVVVLNPPYGTRTTPRTIDWATGNKVSRAALFTARVIERAPEGTRVAAILPDVLRSGTNYARWRDHIRSMLAIEAVESVGRFDEWTDVDVFMLRGRVEPERSVVGDSVHWFKPSADETVSDRFEVGVGSVVPFRDPHHGRLVRYLTVHDVPLGGALDASSAPTRRFKGRLFTPPFVVVRRTSRPGQRSRGAGTIVRGNRRVAVENHLLVCTPRDGTIEACVELQRVLQSEAMDEWLNLRIRCRHLTVKALREVPWRERR